MTERMTATAYRAVRRKPVSREAPIHKAILAHLRKRFPDGLVFHVPNETDLRGPDGARMVVKQRALGMMPGFPDLVVLWRGRWMTFEVKAPRGYPTDDQKTVGAGIIDNGGYWAVVRSTGDVDECLSDWLAGENA